VAVIVLFAQDHVSTPSADPVPRGETGETVHERGAYATYRSRAPVLGQPSPQHTTHTPIGRILSVSNFSD
jgi:hypothetical protein